MAGLLSDVELVDIRADAALAVCDTPCVIQRATSFTPDGLGTQVPVYSTISVAGLLAGLAAPSAGQLSNYAAMIGSLASWKVQLPYGTDVRVQDHLIIGGQTLVVQVDLSPASYNALVTVLASEIR